MTVEEIGCCGAYCKPCLERLRKNNPDERLCWGCKSGYASGERSIKRSRCKVKICCFKERGLQTCADCVDYPAVCYRHSMREKDTQVGDTKNQLTSSEKTGMTSS